MRLIPAVLLVALVACSTESAPEPVVEPAVAAEPAPAPAPVAAPTPAADHPVPTLDLNTATDEAFAAGVPGVGKKMIHEFEEYRPYVSIAQFRKEMAKYVDAATIAEYERYVYVPVDPNASDAATLQQLPGVTATQAEALVAGRSYADADAFLAALTAQVGEDAAKAGAGLLKK
ncbi:MAG: hypothetical protein H6739_32360 [Alphaproteobacteria bacterium]|nr:hypothetical protein [Alphaproteobacteria bacterium]